MSVSGSERKWRVQSCLGSICAATIPNFSMAFCGEGEGGSGRGKEDGKVEGERENTFVNQSF